MKQVVIHKHAEASEGIQVWGSQRLNRVDLYGKNLIPMETL